MQVPEERRKYFAKRAIWVGVVFLVIGFIPGLISYRAGLILFVFSLVVAGLIMIAIPNPDPEHEIFDPKKDKIGSDNDDDSGPIMPWDRPKK